MNEREFAAQHYLDVARFCFYDKLEFEMWCMLFLHVTMLPIYSCDDLGLCNGPNEKHDCVDCPKKRW